LDDPLALRIVGACADGTSPEIFSERYKRFAPAMLSVRCPAGREPNAEDEPRRGGRAVWQHVPGAGLDTFAYRNRTPAFGLEVIIRQRRRGSARSFDAAIPEPDSPTFVLPT
jgi:hypothetical protein